MRIATVCAVAAYFAVTSALILLVDHVFGNGWGWALVPFSCAGCYALGAAFGALRALRSQP